MMVPRNVDMTAEQKAGYLDMTSVALKVEKMVEN